MSAAGELPVVQFADLFGVGAHRSRRRDGVDTAVHGECRNTQGRQRRTEAVPCPVEFPSQCGAIDRSERQRVILKGIQVERIAGQSARIQIYCRVGIDELGDRHQRRPGDDRRAVAPGILQYPKQCDHRTEGMSLRHNRYPRPRSFGELRERFRHCGAVFDGAQLSPRSRRQSVAELVNRPQIDTRGVQRESVPVIEPGVFPEAVQEDHRGPWVGSRPVPVVHRT